MIQRTYYVCDPEKNEECKKRGCAHAQKRGKKPAGDCRATSNPEYAALDGEGKPIVAFVLMRGEDDGTD